MGDRLVRKGFVLGIILLFVGSNFVSGFNIQIKNTTNLLITGRGNTLYVGGSGQGNFTKIQNAIDNATEDDTVFVYSGVYHEFVDVSESINLIGEDPASTIIDGPTPTDYQAVTVSINANNVELSGFTIKSTKNLSATTLCVMVYGYNDNIHGNIMIGGWIGILIDCAFGAHIIGNTFTDNFVGCYLFCSDLTEVSKNNFIDNFQNALFFNGRSNFWDGNYWDDGHSRYFKIIFGGWMDYIPIFIPLINFDWHPAQEPYDIGVCIMNSK